MKSKNPQRYGTIAILGEINVGKSTLLNQLVNRDISIVTHKANTTRKKIKGIISDENTQIVLVDTPGLSLSGKQNPRIFTSNLWEAINEANFLFLMIDCKKTISNNLTQLIHEFNNSSEELPNTILIINKIDKCSKEKLLMISKEMNEYFVFKETFMISALKGHGIKGLRSWMLDNMPEKKWIYSKTKNHDMTMEYILNEKTRETILLRIHQEVPYKIEIDMHELKKFRDGSVKICQMINVSNARHRAMLLGKGGQTIKAISINARLKMEKILNKKVHLFLEVRLMKNKVFGKEIEKGLV